MKRSIFIPLVAILAHMGACTPSQAADNTSAQASDPATTFLSITSSGEEDPHALTMALQLAGHSLDAGRTTVLFFNVRGVTIPTLAFPDSLSFGDRPIKDLLSSLMERGAEVHVCPHCMAAMDVAEGDLMPGAQGTNREALSGHLGEKMVVFTY